MIRVATASRIANLFWPEFEERDGAILLAGTHVTSAAKSFDSLTSFERFFGHTHILDEFRHSIPSLLDEEWESEYPDPSHPEFMAAWELTKRIAQMWCAKLQQDFPERRFRVYATKYADPIVHFHQVREGERPWFTDEEVAERTAADDLVLYQSGPSPAS